MTPAERVGLVTDAGMLNAGDVIDVTDVREGRTYRMTVARAYYDASLGAGHAWTAVAHLRPGGWSVALRSDVLAGSVYAPEGRGWGACYEVRRVAR